MLNEIIQAVTEWYNSEKTFIQKSTELTITASKDIINIQLNRSAEAFKRFINELDDDLFIETCEKLGNENIKLINKALETGEDVEKCISLFKNTLKEIISNKYNYYKECIEKFTDK